MIDMLTQRLEELKQKFTVAQENIKTLNAQLENEKSIALQLMGHFNEATHLLNEAQKLNESQGETNGKELHEGCSEAGEQGKAA